MTSLRHKSLGSARSPDGSARPPGDQQATSTAADLALDAARASILAVGWSRTTLTDIARRAGVSRMTLYRRWPEMNALLGDLMTREWGGLVHARRHRRECPRPAGPQRRRDRPRDPGQRAVHPDRRARPADAAALPARAPRPVAGAGRSTSWSPSSQGRPGGRRGPRRRPGAARPLRRARLPRLHAVGPDDDRRQDHRGQARRRAQHPSREVPAGHERADHRRHRRHPRAHRRARRRPRRDRCRRRPGRRCAGPRRRRRRCLRRRLGHLAMQLQAGARRPALPGQGPGRDRPRERRRARHPDGVDRAAPGARTADGDPADRRRLAPSRRSSPVAASAPATCSAWWRAPVARPCRKPRRISATETRTLAPVVRRDVRGGVLSWDGQLEDDARLVLGIARTAAAHGAHVHTRTRVVEAHRHGALLRDELTGEERRIEAKRRDQRDRRLGRPARRGHHPQAEPRHPRRGPQGAPAGSALRDHGAGARSHRTGSSSPSPSPTGTSTSGSPTSRSTARSPTCRRSPEEDVDFLLDVISRGARATAHPRRRRRCVRRPASAARQRRRDRRPVPQARRADLGDRGHHDRRRQADHLPPDGPGCRRRGASRSAGLAAGPCRTKALPLLGAASREQLAALDAPDAARPPLRHRGAGRARQRPRPRPARDEALRP